jgi:hypothetical protein
MKRTRWPNARRKVYAIEMRYKYSRGFSCSCLKIVFRESVTVFLVSRVMHAKEVSLQLVFPVNCFYYLFKGSCNCNGHGTCLPVEAHYETFFPALKNEYHLWDKERATSCVCDIGKFYRLFSLSF